MEALSPGAFTTIHQPRGRYVGCGIAHDGVADSMPLRLANLSVDNDKEFEGLEVTKTGFCKVQFHASAVISLTGAKARLYTLTAK